MSESVPLRMNRADLGSPDNQVNGAVDEVRHARISSAPGGLPTHLSVVPEERARPPVANEVASASENMDADTLEHQLHSRYEVRTTPHFRGESFDTGMRRPPPSYRTMPGPGSVLSPSNSLRSKGGLSR